MIVLSYLALALMFGAGSGKPLAQTGKPTTDWSLNATIIEACRCPMFCQCYFNTKPAAHTRSAARQLPRPKA